MTAAGAWLDLANRHLHGLKPLLPRRAKRQVLVHLFGVGRETMPHGSRKFLEGQVLPQLPGLGFRRILFVGTAPYTWQYEGIAIRHGATRWATCDINPSAAVWGAHEHVVADIGEIDRHFPADSFDAAIVNGLFGFGIDSPAAIAASVNAIRNVLAPGGLLLFGWNSDVIADPLTPKSLPFPLAPAPTLPFPARQEFADEHFVYDFRTVPAIAGEGVGTQKQRLKATAARLPSRIYSANMGTQLLVIQHLRRHLELPPAREFLIWHPMDNLGLIDELMQSIISTAGFDGVLDIRDFESMRPRTQGSAAWLLESTRRLRRDAARLHAWMQDNAIDEHDAEFWADEPLQFNVTFPRAVLRGARHVKLPHAFNHEDNATIELKADIEREWRQQPWVRQHLFLPWQRWTSGVDVRMERVHYDRAYSFEEPSPWSARRIDVSSLISLEAFAATYATLPAALQQEIETLLRPILAETRPIAVLLLFGLRPGSGPSLEPIYETSLRRIFAEHSAELGNCALVVKAHPGATGPEEYRFIERLRTILPVPVLPLVHGLNLEFLLPLLRPDHVMAGLCGGLPIVRRLGVGRPIALAEMIDAYALDHPEKREVIDRFLDGIAIW